MILDLRKEENRNKFILLFGRLPTKRERNTLKSIKGLYKKKNFTWNQEVSLKKLLEIMKIK